MSAQNVQTANKKVILLGLPNTGKSNVFNNLTGDYTLVGNYQYTTVEIRTGQSKIAGQTYDVIDTPGLHSLYIHSEEELLVRDMLMQEKPDAVVQCIDANRLKQSLSLTADLLDLGLPLVISLNAIDETTRRGIWIDSNALSEYLGVPVIESVPIHNEGTKELMAAITQAANGSSSIQYEKQIEDGIKALISQMPEHIHYKRKFAVLLLLKDPFIFEFLRNQFGHQAANSLMDSADGIRREFQFNPSQSVNQKKNKWIDRITEQIFKTQKVKLTGVSPAIAQLCRDPVFGFPILFAILTVMYVLVVNVANVIADWMDESLWTPVYNQLDETITSPFLHDFLIGDYGILSLGFANALLTVLPILSVFFLAFNIIEDMGYIPNLCVLTKKIFEKIGLSGGAIMPLVLGFGCKTMATLTTKSIRSKREQYIAIYMIAFAIPCAAQMGLNMSILGKMGISAFFIAFSVLFVVEIVAGLILNLILKKEEKAGYIQELPPIRVPEISAVVKKTYYRLIWFLKEAVPIFIYAAVILFAVDRMGILDKLKSSVGPLMTEFLGLPLEMVDALILCMARHEAAAGLIFGMVDGGRLDYIQCIVAVTITTMFVPCFTNIMAMIKQLGGVRALAMAVVINLSAILIGGALNWALVLFQ